MKKIYFVALAVFAAALFGAGYNAFAADYGTSSGASGYSHEMSGTSGAAGQPCPAIKRCTGTSSIPRA